MLLMILTRKEKMPEVELVRLNKYIASNGILSRRKIDELITQGRVDVNGITIMELGHKINAGKDKVDVDGQRVKAVTKKIYIILNKPDSVITSTSDEKRRRTVMDIVKINDKIFPVGRLDYHTTGLLLLTNDGELANKLMSPKSKVYKTYQVKLSKPLEEKHRVKLSGGIRIEKVKTLPSKIDFITDGDYTRLKISITEGKNRQVRKMFEHYGYFVRELHRSAYAGLKLEKMKFGEWRHLTKAEIDILNSK